jgi:hypothetical protein
VEDPVAVLLAPAQEAWRLVLDYLERSRHHPVERGRFVLGQVAGLRPWPLARLLLASEDARAPAGVIAGIGEEGEDLLRWPGDLDRALD